MDSVHAAGAFAEHLEIASFPLLGDLKKEVCKSYGVLREEGFSERVTYLIDPDGRVRYRDWVAMDQERSIVDYLAVVEAVIAPSKAPE